MLRRPLVALVALAAVGVLAAGCGSNGSGSSAGGMGGYGSSGTAPATGGASSVATVSATSTSLGTYNKHPLYCFARDSQAGQHNGQGVDAFGAEWCAVTTPDGGAVTGA